MPTKFFEDIVDKKSFKIVPTEEAKNAFSKSGNVLLVHSPILYRLYVLHAEADEVLSRTDFYRSAGFYLYYEKFLCKHGNEFYYWIKFNKDSEFYKTHKAMIHNLIIANDPSEMTDYIGYLDLNVYNKQLKEKLL